MVIFEWEVRRGTMEEKEVIKYNCFFLGKAKYPKNPKNWRKCLNVDYNNLQK